MTLLWSSPLPTAVFGNFSYSDHIFPSHVTIRILLKSNYEGNSYIRSLCTEIRGHFTLMFLPCLRVFTTINDYLWHPDGSSFFVSNQKVLDLQTSLWEKLKNFEIKNIITWNSGVDLYKEHGKVLNFTTADRLLHWRIQYIFELYV